MSTIDTRPIVLPLVFNASHPRYADNRAMLYTALNAGWVCLQYRKTDGVIATRMATRNPSIVKAFGTDDDIENLATDNSYPASILYFDHSAGGLRSFRVDSIHEAFIPSAPPEINH